MSRRGRSLLSIFIHSKLHDSDQTSQCIRLDPLYLIFLEQPTFLSAKKTKQQPTFMVLSRGAQPSIPAGRRPACPTFQQPMRPAISLFSLNRQPGPSQVQEPKGHEPCGSPNTVP
ncbi:hypothetical protein ACFX2G_044944 [Malus domestica]